MPRQRRASRPAREGEAGGTGCGESEKHLHSLLVVAAAAAAAGEGPVVDSWCITQLECFGVLLGLVWGRERWLLRRGGARKHDRGWLVVWQGWVVVVGVVRSRPLFHGRCTGLRQTLEA